MTTVTVKINKLL